MIYPYEDPSRFAAPYEREEERIDEPDFFDDEQTNENETTEL